MFSRRAFSAMLAGSVAAMRGSLPRQRRDGAIPVSVSELAATTMTFQMPTR